MSKSAEDLPYWKDKCEKCIYATNISVRVWEDAWGHPVLTTHNWDCARFQENVHTIQHNKCNGPFCAFQAMLHAENKSA